MLTLLFQPIDCSVPGEMVTLNNQIIYISSCYLFCGRGFGESKRIKILSFGKLDHNEWKTQADILIYHTNQPLVGFSSNVECPEEMASFVVHKYVATLRSFPEVDRIFVRLSERCNMVKASYHSLSNCDVITTADYSALVYAIRTLWSQTTEEILLTSPLVAALGK